MLCEDRHREQAGPQKRGSPEDIDQPTLAERASWREAALAWTKSCDSQMKRGRRQDRLSAFSWIQELDNALALACGRGLAYWSRLSPHPDAPAWGKERAPRLAVVSLSSDNGSDGYCARWFLKHSFRLVLLDFEDVVHGIHRDMENALSSCSVLRERLFLNGIHFNLDWGNFGSGAWHQDIIEAAQSYMSKADEHDPIFASLLPRFARDMGCQHELEQPGFPKKAWQYFINHAMTPK